MTLELTALILAFAGLLFLGLALKRVWHRRLAGGLGHGCCGALLVVSGALLGAIALNLHTYHRLTAEQAVVQLEFAQISPGHYLARLERPDGKRELYELDGDAWQLDARVLKWHGPAVLVGFDTAYRLERLSGRYSAVDDYRDKSPAVYALGDDRGVDLWQLSSRHSRWLPMVDAIYGSATYMPMTDGARYDVTISTTGLVTRPANAAARRAVDRW